MQLVPPRWVPGEPTNAGKFEALNAALFNGGSFIYVPPDTTVTLPVRTIFWASDPQAKDTAALLADFEKKVKPDPAAVSVGFSSRQPAQPTEGDRCGLGFTRGPLHTHVLLREAPACTEAERVEALAHELAHLLGAAHSPDPLSLMRPKLDDGKARSAKFRLALDPLNSLAVGIWAEEIRDARAKGWGDLRSP